jgi:outer membrane biosynthesis protein TonB
MIQRILVPRQLSLASPETGEKSQRTSTFLDNRQLVPAELPVVALESRSNIPSHVPLEVLGERIVVPRHMPDTPLQITSETASHSGLGSLDSRIAVPRDALPNELTLAEKSFLRKIGEKDVLTTGEANLFMEIDEEEKGRRRAVRVAAFGVTGLTALNLTMIFLSLLLLRLFPSRPPTHEEIAAAARSLGMIYTPPQAEIVPKVEPAPGNRPSDQMRIDPRVLKQLAPEAMPSPLPGIPAPPPQPQPRAELPDAPRPQSSDTNGSPGQPSRGELTLRDVPRIESAKQQPAPGQLILPRMSPGRAIEDLARNSTSGSQSGPTITFGGPLTGRGGYGGPSGGGGTGEGLGALQMLTPTEGVDFTNYLTRVLASIKRNWYAVIPESARLGERGRVVLQFRILRDGSVPSMDPRLMVTSTKDHLDRAAMSSIRASNPFEPLPQQFSGPFIELRIIYLYNLPLDYR